MTWLTLDGAKRTNVWSGRDNFAGMDRRVRGGEQKEGRSDEALVIGGHVLVQIILIPVL